MLGKLLRYEFKATAKLFLYMYLAIFVIAAINMLLLPVEFGPESNNAFFPIIFRGIMIFLYVMGALAVLVITVIAIISRFYKNQLGDEGYLMFTLPVSVDKHIFSKLIVATLWGLLSLLVIGLSLLLMLARLGSLRVITDFWTALTEGGLNPVFWLLGILFVLLLQAVAGNLQYYAAMAAGPHLIRNRLGGSILCYIIIYVIYNLVSVLLTFLWLMPAFNIPAGDLATMEGADSPALSVALGFIGKNGAAAINAQGLYWMGYALLLALLTALPCYFFTRHMLTKKLNLG